MSHQNSIYINQPNNPSTKQLPPPKTLKISKVKSNNTLSPQTPISSSIPSTPLNELAMNLKPVTMGVTKKASKNYHFIPKNDSGENIGENMEHLLLGLKKVSDNKKNDSKKAKLTGKMKGGMSQDLTASQTNLYESVKLKRTEMNVENKKKNVVNPNAKSTQNSKVPKVKPIIKTTAIASMKQNNKPQTPKTVATNVFTKKPKKQQQQNQQPTITKQPKSSVKIPDSSKQQQTSINSSPLERPKLKKPDVLPTSKPKPFSIITTTAPPSALLNKTPKTPVVENLTKINVQPNYESNYEPVPMTPAESIISVQVPTVPRSISPETPKPTAVLMQMVPFAPEPMIVKKVEPPKKLQKKLK